MSSQIVISSTNKNKKRTTRKVWTKLQNIEVNVKFIFGAKYCNPSANQPEYSEIFKKCGTELCNNCNWSIPSYGVQSIEIKRRAMYFFSVLQHFAYEMEMYFVRIFTRWTKTRLMVIYKAAAQKGMGVISQISCALLVHVYSALC